MTNEVFGFDGNDTRRIFETVDIVLGTQSGEGSASRASDVAMPVVVKPVDTLVTLAAFMTSQFDVTLWTLNGDDLEDLKAVEPVRLLTNGKQIAFPVSGLGLCVQDSAFWAVNIGSLDPATHPLTGQKIGRAGLFRINEDGSLSITDDRENFVRRDEADIIADGTLIQLAYVSGSLTIVWASCEPHPDLKDLDPTP